MFERFTEPARQTMRWAQEESDRLGHQYLGCEHILAALARQPNSPTGQALGTCGLDLATIRTELDRLITAAVLPRPSRTDAELLAEWGIDLDTVQQSIRDTFGAQAVDDAARQVSRRTGWTPLCGKAVIIKQAFYYARQHADRGGRSRINTIDLLLGVLTDAEHDIDKPHCFRNPWNHRRRTRLGLPHRGPTPIRLIIEARHLTFQHLRAAAQGTQHASGRG